MGPDLSKSEIISSKIVNTLKSSTRDPVDIASLTASIVSTTKVKPTAALYMRIAFIVC